jgi:hypothetical protein
MVLSGLLHVHKLARTPANSSCIRRKCDFVEQENSPGPVGKLDYLCLDQQTGQSCPCSLHKLVCKLLYLCQTHRIWNFSCYFAVKDNKVADLLSRQTLNPQHEVQLPIQIFPSWKRSLDGARSICSRRKRLDRRHYTTHLTTKRQPKGWTL